MKQIFNFTLITAFLLSTTAVTANAKFFEKHLDPNLIESLLTSEAVKILPCDHCTKGSVRLLLDTGYEGTWMPMSSTEEQNNVLIAQTLIDQQLELKIVPPTVEKEYQGERGVFQVTDHQRFLLSKNATLPVFDLFKYLVGDDSVKKPHGKSPQSGLMKKLKETSEEQWKLLLSNRYTPERLEKFLARRKEILTDRSF